MHIHSRVVNIVPSTTISPDLFARGQHWSSDGNFEHQ